MTAVEAFQSLVLWVGRIQRVEANGKARKPAYKLWIDFGPLGMKQLSAKITDLYTAAGMTGRLVITAGNLGTRTAPSWDSEVLVLGLPDEEGRVVLLAPERDVPPGGRVF